MLKREEFEAEIKKGQIRTLIFKYNKCVTELASFHKVEQYKEFCTEFASYPNHEEYKIMNLGSGSDDCYTIKIGEIDKVAIKELYNAVKGAQ